MLHILAAAALFCFSARPETAQDARRILRLTVSVLDEAQKPVPVPRHVLLVSDDPPTSPPRPIRTAHDGTATMRLGPGRYTVESEQPLKLHGRTYEWRQTIEITAGRDAVLELTAANAEISAGGGEAAASVSPTPEPSSLLARWQNSVVGVWSPTARASGVLVDGRGLIVTSQQVAGSATSAEVELTPTMKVAARVLEADPVRGVAVLWIDPGAAESLTPVPPGCGRGAQPIADGQEIAAIGASLRGGKRTTSGSVEDIEGRIFVADFALAADHAGGPVFAAGGRLLGIVASMDEDESHRRAESRVVRVEEVCAAVAAAELRMKDDVAPAASRLPVEADRPFPPDALETAAQRVGGLDSYRLSSSSYDVTFITPPLLYAAQHRGEQSKARDRAGARGTPDPRTIDPLDDFSNWSAYVAGLPPVLMIRATPKLAEGFWTKVARGAVQTQGVSLPPIKRFKPGFGRLQAFCGTVEVTPIHPLRIEQRVSESDAVYEGLYVFDPAALGPACGSVKLVLYSEKEPRNADTRVVDPRVIQQAWDDFASYRALKPE